MAELNLYMNNRQQEAQERTLSFLYGVLFNYHILSENWESKILSDLKPHEREIFEKRLFKVPDEVLNKIIDNTPKDKLQWIMDTRPLSSLIWWIITTKIQERMIMLFLESDPNVKVEKIGTDEVLFDMSKAFSRPDLRIINKKTGETYLLELQHCNYLVYPNYSGSNLLEIKQHKMNKAENILCYYEKNSNIYVGLVKPKNMVTYNNKKDNEIINSYYKQALPNQRKPGYIINDSKIATKFIKIDEITKNGIDYLFNNGLLVKREKNI